MKNVVGPYNRRPQLSGPLVPLLTELSDRGPTLGLYTRLEQSLLTWLNRVKQSFVHHCSWVFQTTRTKISRMVPDPGPVPDLHDLGELRDVEEPRD